MGKIIGKSIRSEHFGVLQLWELFCQPFGENLFSERGPKRASKSSKNCKVFEATKLQLGILVRCLFWVCVFENMFFLGAGKIIH